jgi:hypothetical protein
MRSLFSFEIEAFFVKLTPVLLDGVLRDVGAIICDITLPFIYATTRRDIRSRLIFIKLFVY